MVKFLRSIAAASVLLIAPTGAWACGGFFCQLVPIDQAAEQIVFSQQGNQIEALVLIDYEGDAEAFSWIVPVPANITREGVLVGSESFFQELEAVTQPQFVLDREGEACDFPLTDGGSTGGVGENANTDASGGGVETERFEVGPFDVELISSDNPDELATWLVDNEYDLSDRGRDLIEPYVLAGMKFVGLQLQSGQSSGSIQPILLRYQSEKPMIPIRLTAVAAEDDMGVLVWLVGPARAVPENYLHVLPNYTRLDWFSGFGGYSSFQTLVTEAMDEAGGQGFATEMAGRIDTNLLANLTDPTILSGQLDDLTNATDAAAIAALANLGQSSAFQTTLTAALPLPAGQGTFVYRDVGSLESIFTSQALANARPSLLASFREIELDPLVASRSLLRSGDYLTRLYTTLSAEEMTLDPEFVYNDQMPDQPRERRATLSMHCGDNGTEWNLTLGAGTGREGEVVIRATGPVPFFGAVPEAASQQASFIQERTFADALPQVTVQNVVPALEINGGSTIDPESTDVATSSDNGGIGSLSSIGCLALALLVAYRRRLAA